MKPRGLDPKTVVLIGLVVSLLVAAAGIALLLILRGGRMIEFLTYIVVVGALIVAFLFGYLFRYFGELEQDKHLPYRLRNGLEDMAAVDTDTLFMIRDALLLVEARVGDKQRIVAEIRQGRYDPEQPAAVRKGNGRKG